MCENILNLGQFCVKLRAYKCLSPYLLEHDFENEEIKPQAVIHVIYLENNLRFAFQV
jgi:hypothetical protein